MCVAFEWAFSATGAVWGPVAKGDVHPPKKAAFITPLEVTNTGPGVNRGSGGGARGGGFEERVDVHARTGKIHFLWLFCLSVRLSGAKIGSLDPLQ